MLATWVLAIFLGAASANPVLRSDADNSAYMLPKTVVPSSYTILLKLEENFFTTNSFTGVVSIDVTAKEAVTEIKLHSKDITIDGKPTLVIKGQTDEIPIQNGPYVSNADTNILSIKPVAALAVGEYTLTFPSYTGKLSVDDMHGFYKSSYENENGDTEYLATTQFESTHARRAFPCFDEPSFKATFDLSVTYPKGYNVKANTEPSGPPVGNVGNLETVTFFQTPKMSTYLNAFIVSKFTCQNGVNLQGNAPYRVCSRNEAAATRALALQEGPALMKALEDFTGILYSSKIGKMEQVAIPDFSAGAMENWGLITYREAALLYSDEESSNINQQSIVTIIAHEFTHMWFGNLVTLGWWKDVFLNEGFARYFQFFATHKVKPLWEMDKQFVTAQVHSALLLDSSDSVLALSSDVYTPEEISARFDSISYNKGASILRMVTHIMTSEKFQEGVRDYLRAHSEGNTVPSDLWTALESKVTLPHKLTLVLENWTLKPGHPVLTVKLDKKNAVVTQKRFFLSGEVTDQNQHKWFVPVTYSTASQTNKFEVTAPQAWLTPTAENLVLENAVGDSDWIILNNQQTGYYRVNYDDTLWNRISLGLKKDNFDGINVLNRAQIVDDLFNFGRTGDLKYNKILEIVSFLSKDVDYYPWIPAFNGFSYTLGKIGSANLRKSLNNHVLKLLDGLYKSVPFKTEKPNDHIYTLKQSLALSWACQLGNADCVKNSQELFAAYRTAGTKPSRNQKSVVYCTALRNSAGAKADWDFLWDKFKSEKLSTEKVTILTALGCTKNEAILQDYLLKAVSENSGIRRQDSQTAVASVYRGNPEGVTIAFNFLAKNYEKVATYYNSDVTVSKLIKDIAELFTTKSQADELQKLINGGKLNDKVKASAEEVLKTVNTNLEWIKGFEKQLTDYFKIDDGGAASTARAGFTLIVGVIVLYLMF